MKRGVRLLARVLIWTVGLLLFAMIILQQFGWLLGGGPGWIWAK